ncbi:hypothetical protein BC830DRAFT_1072027, partial [Chytriomyces sp. MP71]
DHMAFVKARSDFVKAQLVRTEEINFVREKMKWCYRREGVNHLQNCRDITLQVPLHILLVMVVEALWVADMS